MNHRNNKFPPYPTLHPSIPTLSLDMPNAIRTQFNSISEFYVQLFRQKHIVLTIPNPRPLPIFKFSKPRQHLKLSFLSGAKLNSQFHLLCGGIRLDNLNVFVKFECDRRLYSYAMDVGGQDNTVSVFTEFYLGYLSRSPSHSEVTFVDSAALSKKLTARQHHSIAIYLNELVYTYDRQQLSLTTICSLLGFGTNSVIPQLNVSHVHESLSLEAEKLLISTSTTSSYTHYIDMNMQQEEETSLATSFNHENNSENNTLKYKELKPQTQLQQDTISDHVRSFMRGEVFQPESPPAPVPAPLANPSNQQPQYYYDGMPQRERGRARRQTDIPSLMSLKVDKPIIENLDNDSKDNWPTHGQEKMDSREEPDSTLENTSEPFKTAVEMNNSATPRRYFGARPKNISQVIDETVQATLEDVQHQLPLTSSFQSSQQKITPEFSPSPFIQANQQHLQHHPSYQAPQQHYPQQQHPLPPPHNSLQPQQLPPQQHQQPYSQPFQQQQQHPPQPQHPQHQHQQYPPQHQQHPPQHQQQQHQPQPQQYQPPPHPLPPQQQQHPPPSQQQQYPPQPPQPQSHSHPSPSTEQQTHFETLGYPKSEPTKPQKIHPQYSMNMPPGAVGFTPYPVHLLAPEASAPPPPRDEDHYPPLNQSQLTSGHHTNTSGQVTTTAPSTPKTVSQNATQSTDKNESLLSKTLRALSPK